MDSPQHFKNERRVIFTATTPRTIGKEKAAARQEALAQATATLKATTVWHKYPLFVKHFFHFFP
jgi:hypothetical protein